MDRQKEFDTSIDLKDFETPIVDPINVAEDVLGNDDRQVVPNVLMMPWRSVCALRIVAADGQRVFGTGFLTRPDTVITAAHNVFNHRRGGKALGILVIPALNGVAMPAGSHAAVGLPKLPPNWIKDPTAATDFAAIKVASAVVDPSSVMTCAHLPSNIATSTNLVITGYPTDRDNATRQYFHARRASAASTDQFTYDIDTEDGQSGSPIIANIPIPMVVGIHRSGTTVANSGVRFTKQALTLIASW